MKNMKKHCTLMLPESVIFQKFIYFFFFFLAQPSSQNIKVVFFMFFTSQPYKMLLTLNIANIMLAFWLSCLQHCHQCWVEYSDCVFMVRGNATCQFCNPSNQLFGHKQSVTFKISCISQSLIALTECLFKRTCTVNYKSRKG